MELRKWQKKVLEDDSYKVKVNKGRQIGATSLTPYIPQDERLLYITQSYNMALNAYRLVYKIIEEDERLEIIHNKERNILYIGRNNYSNIIHFAYEGEYIDTFLEGRKIKYDKVILDEVAFDDFNLLDNNSMFDNLNQIYNFMSLDIQDMSIYTVPTLGNVGKHNNNKELRDVYNDEVFDKNIKANVLIEDLDDEEKELMLMDDIKEVDKDKVREFIKYKGNIYKLDN